MPGEIADHMANVSVIDTRTHLPGVTIAGGPSSAIPRPSGRATQPVPAQRTSGPTSLVAGAVTGRDRRTCCLTPAGTRRGW